MSLILPNSFANATNADAAPLQENFDVLEDYLNHGIITADGLTPMAAPLILVGDPIAGADDKVAVNKGYVDPKIASLTSDKVSKLGDTMTGLLVASGSVQLPIQGGATGLPLASQAIRKDYADSVYVNVTGDTMAGELRLPSTQSTTSTAAVHKSYVDGTFLKQTGDTITGTLNMTRAGEAPLIQMYNVAGTDRFGYIQGFATAMITAIDDAAGQVRHMVGGTIRQTVTSSGVNVTGALDVRDATTTGSLNVEGNVVVGNDPNPDVPVAGVRLNAAGGIVVVPPASAALSTPNMIIGRGGSPAAGTSGQFVRFDRGTATIGTITIDSATTTAFNTTSDERTKHRDGDVDDAAGRVQRLGAQVFSGQMLDDDGNPDGTLRDLIYAHEVAVEAPYVVSGERGGEEFQTVNFTGLIPLLLAALGNALDRIAVLEAA